MAMLFTTTFAQNNLAFANLTDGEYYFEDNKQSLKMIIKDDNLEKFELNGVLIPESDYSKHQELISNVMNKLQKNHKTLKQNEKDRQAFEKREGKLTNNKGAQILN